MQRVLRVRKGVRWFSVDFSTRNRDDYTCRVNSLVRAYRQYGHMEATLDPLGLDLPKQNTVELRMGNYDLNEKDLDREINIQNILHIGSLSHPKRTATLREIVDYLKKVYSNNIAAQFIHVENAKEVHWLGKKTRINC
jgi:2-oxoglutarate dehydrogenase complex dehydrogenase (E1) component-like enzyme